jgi:serine phosphatase RsbU (regulator of sigma subunit)
MPFQPLTVSIPFILRGLDSFSDQYPYQGSASCGDALFVETKRADGGVMLLLVDVMGHGDPAAATVVHLRDVILRNPRCHDLRPAELLLLLDQMLEAEFNGNGRFVAALALLVDWQGGTVEGANAGLPEPRHGDGGGVWQAWSFPSGPLLGLCLPGAAWQNASIPLLAGHYLLAFTDGVTEAGQGKSFQFQQGALQAYLAGLPAGTTPEQAIEGLLQELRLHVGTTWPEDDTTALCLRHP